MLIVARGSGQVQGWLEALAGIYLNGLRRWPAPFIMRGSPDCFPRCACKLLRSQQFGRIGV